jgi:uncharacterized glyoxalase superfamily protein PhnB
MAVYHFEIILYVANQEKSKMFYSSMLELQPTLDVPGMTEFTIHSYLKLGLMPEEGIAKILADKMPHPAIGNGIPRCELYLSVVDVLQAYDKAIACGAKGVSPPMARDWGDTVAYVADADGHVLAFAEKTV